jgi:hypothetical protein
MDETSSQEKRDAYADQIGADGLVILKAIWDAASPVWMREVPAIRTLHRFEYRILPGGMKINLAGIFILNTGKIHFVKHGEINLSG